MQFITGNNRYQTFFSTLEEQLSIDNTVRLIDAFIDKADLEKMGFTKTFIRVKAGVFSLMVVKEMFRVP